MYKQIYCMYIFTLSNYVVFYVDQWAMCDALYLLVLEEKRCIHGGLALLTEYKHSKVNY